MNSTVVNVVTLLLLVTSLFWSFGTHTQHCQVANKVGMKCVSHNYHLTIGVVLFLSAMVLAHRKHLSKYAPVLKKLN